MEKTLSTPDRGQRVIEEERRFMKAGTYTLADKYAIVIEGFKRRCQ